MIGLSLGLGGRMTGKRSKNYPTIFFNGLDTTGNTSYTGGPTYVQDNLGVIGSPAANYPAVEGMRLDGTTYKDTLIDGVTPIVPSVDQPTRTFDAGFTAPSAGPTFKDYTRPTPLTAPGWLCEPARTNKCTCRKANPVDTTNLVKALDAAAVLSVVDDTAALTAAGLIGVCNSGKVYKLDNSLGVATAIARVSGIPGNTNVHSYCAYVRGGAGSFSLYFVGVPSVVTFTSSAGYRVIKKENVTTTATLANFEINANAGQVVYFILPQLEEGAFCTSPITTPTDPLTAITRAGTVLTYPTAGKIRSNDIALKLSVVPRGTGQSGYLWGSYTDASNFCYLSINPYDITFKSVVAGISKDVAIASYTHTQGVPFEVILCKSTQGSQLLVREYTGGAWQAWVRGGLSVTSDNLVLGTSYTLGSFNNTSQFTGNISEVDTLLIPSGIANPTAWVESQWNVNGAGSNPVIFNHTFTGLTLLDGVLKTKSATDSVTINWGDGTSNTYAGTSDTAFTHTYASATTIYNVTWTASDSTVLTKISYTDRAGGKVSGVLSLPASMTYFVCTGLNTLSGVLSLPASMTYFTCYGQNTLSGALSLPASMTYFSCSGSNTLSGALSLPALMTYFGCSGSNTLSGALSLPALMTYFNCMGSNTLSGILSLPAAMTTFTCYGQNTLSGALSLPASMTSFDCRGSNTLSGALSLPAAMTIFVCQGFNTLSGVLSLPAAMTTFTCTGSNTLSGVLSLPASMTYFICTGYNTLSGYTPSAKAVNQQRLTVAGLNTLSAANVDAIIQDYANAGGTWGGDKIFSLTVLTASNRTAASDAAWTTLGTKGLATQTITLR